MDNRHVELFQRVASCNACVNDAKALADRVENLPQPGFVGKRFFQDRRLAVILQNPRTPDAKTPPATLERERIYQQMLAECAQSATLESVASLNAYTQDFMTRDWPAGDVVRRLLQAVGYNFDDIAFFNAVRCRTRNLQKTMPSSGMVGQCYERHLLAWLEVLAPRYVVIVGAEVANARSGSFVGSLEDAVRSKGFKVGMIERRHYLKDLPRIREEILEAKLISP